MQANTLFPERILKNVKNVLLALTLFLCSQLVSMEQPPQAPQQNLVSLQGLPNDLKRYLAPFIASGDVERGILTAASISRSFHNAINDPTILRAILDWTVASAKHTAPVIDIAERLQNKSFLLPGMQKPEIDTWIANAKAQLLMGPELYKAVEQDNLQQVKDLLILKDINLNWAQSGNRTPLIRAVGAGYIEIVTLLLEAGANPNATDVLKQTPLRWAAYSNQPSITELLLNFKANPNIPDDYGTTPLIEAAEKGLEAVVAKLLAYKADPNIQDDSGNTALLINIVRKGNAKITQMLLDAGANPNTQDNDGMTTLMGAVLQKDASVVKALLDAGADPNIKHNNGVNALSFALKYSTEEIIGLLISAGAKR